MVFSLGSTTVTDGRVKEYSTEIITNAGKQ
jgi:hypothetical protein